MISARLVVVGALGIVVGACNTVSTTPETPNVGGMGGAAGQGGTAGNFGMGGLSGAGGSSVGGAVGAGGIMSGFGGSAGVSGQAGGVGGMSAGGTGGSSGETFGGSGGNSGSDAGGTGGSGAGGTGAGSGLPKGNPPELSSGCGQANTLMNGTHTIRSSNADRTYILDIPQGYDNNTPHRLFYTSHWINARSEDVQGQDYYFLKPLAQRDGVPAIFVAPQSDDGRWDEADHALFDDILALVKEDLCIDTTRVFATGFSFGGMITYSLSVNHQQEIRAAVGIAPANYNIYVPPKTGEPIAWMQTTGMGDMTCPWVRDGSPTQGAKYIALEHATNNGCDVPSDFPIWEQGGHVCYDFEGCPDNYPTKACTFAGGHTNIDNENGENWIATESWEFFNQF